MHQGHSILVMLLIPVSMLLRMVKFVAGVAVACHLVACIWSTLASPPGVPAPVPASVRYATSIYWAVSTMTSTGYGDIVPHTETGMIFASTVMIGAKLLFGFVLGNIASTLANAMYRHVRYKETVQAGQEELVERGPEKHGLDG